MTACQPSCLQQLVDPGCAIPSEAPAIHGITNRMTRGKLSPEKFLPQFLGFLGGPDTVLLAYNASFDLGFLGMSMRRAGIVPPSHCVLDAVALARRCLPGLRTCGLEHLARCLGVADCEEHRALADSRMLMSVTLQLLANCQGLRTVNDLYRLVGPFGFDECGVLESRAPEGYEELTVAIREGAVVALLYQGSYPRAAWRKVTPHGFFTSKGRQYLLGQCHADGIEKTYRLDRILEFRRELSGELS
jgi:DNA polymerase III epsilon subunit-like protein